jgi:hypothetical protein
MSYTSGLVKFLNKWITMGIRHIIFASIENSPIYHLSIALLFQTVKYTDLLLEVCCLDDQGWSLDSFDFPKIRIWNWWDFLRERDVFSFLHFYHFQKAIEQNWKLSEVRSVRAQNRIPQSTVPWDVEYFELKKIGRDSESRSFWNFPALHSPSFFYPKASQP